jgi:hypothetical protein
MTDAVPSFAWRSGLTDVPPQRFDSSVFGPEQRIPLFLSCTALISFDMKSNLPALTRHYSYTYVTTTLGHHTIRFSLTPSCYCTRADTPPLIAIAVCGHVGSLLARHSS